LHFAYAGPKPKRGPTPRLGEPVDVRKIPYQYLKETKIANGFEIRTYQMPLLHQDFPDFLNVVILLRTNLATGAWANVILFSSDLALSYDKLIDYYSLRFQIEFNFRDAKQFWGLEDFMNVSQNAVTNAANQALFMVDVSQVLMCEYRHDDPDFSILDLKAIYRGYRYVTETIQILPQKPDEHLVSQFFRKVAALGRIHPANLPVSSPLLAKVLEDGKFNNLPASEVVIKELPRRDATPALAKKALSLMTRSPWLVLVREPDQLGVERAHPQLAFGVRLVELAEPNRHVAADDDRTPASLDDHHLRPACVARRRDKPEPGKQFELAVDRHVPHAGRIDPLANSVVVLAARVVELPTLDVDRPASEEVIATTVVEVQVCVDDDVNASEVETLLAQWTEAGIKIGRRRVQLRHAGVDQHTRIGMVDDVHVDRYPLALGEQIGNLDWRDGDFLFQGKSPLRDCRTNVLFCQDRNKLNSEPARASQPGVERDAGAAPAQTPTLYSWTA